MKKVTIKKVDIEIVELSCDVCGKSFTEKTRGHFWLNTSANDKVAYEYFPAPDMCKKCVRKLDNFVSSELTKLGLVERYAKSEEGKERELRRLKVICDLGEEGLEDE